MAIVNYYAVVFLVRQVLWAPLFLAIRHFSGKGGGVGVYIFGAPPVAETSYPARYFLAGPSQGPGHLKPVILKPVGRMSNLGEFDLPGVVPGALPRTLILRFKTRVAGSWLGIARTEPWNPSDRKSELIFGKWIWTATFQFSESGGSLNGPDLFTELPFL